MKESILAQKAMNFAVKIVNLHKELVYKKKEYQIADQIKRSGTSSTLDLHIFYAEFLA